MKKLTCTECACAENVDMELPAGMEQRCANCASPLVYGGTDGAQAHLFLKGPFPQSPPFTICACDSGHGCGHREAYETLRQALAGKVVVENGPEGASTRKDEGQPPVVGDSVTTPPGPSSDDGIDWLSAYEKMRWLAIKAIGDLGAMCAPNVPESSTVRMLRGIHAQRCAELDELPGNEEVCRALSR